MAITWTARKIDNGVVQIKFSVKSDDKTSRVRGTVPLDEDETTTEPLVDWLKAKIGSTAVSTFETQAANVDDNPPPVPFT